MTTLGNAREAIYQRVFNSAELRAIIRGLALGDQAFEPPSGKPWARITVNHTASRQGSIGAPGNRRFDRRAVANFEVFVPRRNEDKEVIRDNLLQIGQQLFEGYSPEDSTIRFGDVVPREDGSDDLWLRGRLEAQFTYQEVK